MASRRSLLLFMSAVLLALVGSLLTVGTGRSADAVQLPKATIVSDDPVDWTPHALNGEVHALIQIGNRVIVGGTFTTIRSATSTTQISRRAIFAYNATTGALDNAFLPTVNGNVETLLPSDDGQSVYVGGSFTTVNGTSRTRLARINLADGSLDATFRPQHQRFGLRHEDVRRPDLPRRPFSQVGGVSHTLMATVNPVTGAVDPVS